MKKYFDSYENLRKNNLIVPGIYDPIFKLIMTKHQDYFLFIVSSILNISMDELIEGYFKNIEMPSGNNNYKLIRTDLTYKTKNNLLVIEANIDNNSRLKTRNKIHLGRAIDNEYSNKNDESKANIIYQLNFNRKNKLKNESLIRMQLWDKKLNIGEEEIYKIEINLDVIYKKYYNNNKLIKLEKALLLLILDNKEEIEKIGEDDNMLKEVGNTIIDYSTEEAKYAELREIELNEDLCFMEGEAKGLKKGEKQKQLEIAKNLLIMGLPLGQVSQGTGLPIDKVQSLNIGNK